MLAMSLGTIVSGPIVAYEFVEKTYKSVEYKNLQLRQLKFKNQAVLKGFVVNRSKKILKDCRVNGKLFNKTDSGIKRFFSLVKPQSKAETIAKGEMHPNQILPFRLDFKNIHYSQDLDISLKIRCK